jgi:hypothetical protein
MVTLAQRATACPRWRWLPGMVYFDESGVKYRVRSEWHAAVLRNDLRPDLSDPATRGCLLLLVREMWGPHASLLANGFEAADRVWSVHCGVISHAQYGHEVSVGSSEEEAMVAALETPLWEGLPNP